MHSLIKNDTIGNYKMIKAYKRLLSDLKELESDTYTNVSASPREKMVLNEEGEILKEKDLLTWDAIIVGPSDTPYSGGIFRIVITFSYEYPFKAPVVTFLTPVYHPNISDKGTVCLNILKNDWKPSYDVAKILLCISSLLNNPNPNDPLMSTIAKELISQPDKFAKTAKEWTTQYAS